MSAMASKILTAVALLSANMPCVSQRQPGHTQTTQSDPHKWIKFEFFMEPDCIEEANSTFWVPEDYCMLGNFSQGEEGELGRVLRWHRWSCNSTHVHHHEWAGDPTSWGRSYCQAGNWNRELTKAPFNQDSSNYSAPNGGRRFCGALHTDIGGPHWNITCDLETPTSPNPTSEPVDGMWLGNCSQEGSGTGASFHCGYDGTGDIAGVVHNPIDCSYNTNGTHELYGTTGAAKMKYSSACIPSGWLSGSPMAVPAMTVALLLTALFDWNVVRA